MSDNALDRLMSKQKPKVPPRNDEIIQDFKEPITLEVKTSSIQDLKTERVQNTLRIDKSIDDLVRELCYQERISKETLFEAAYLYLSERPLELEAVVEVARDRLNKRKAIADCKRAKTMQERFLHIDMGIPVSKN